MKKLILSLLLGFAVSCIFLFSMNANAPVMETSGTLSAVELSRPVYIHFAHQRDSGHIRLQYQIPADHEPLGLLLENISSFTLTENGTVLYSCQEEDAGQAVYIIPVSEAGSRELELTIETPYIRRQTTLVLGRLGDLEQLRTIRQNNDVTFMSLQLFAILISLVLFLSKKSERYLVGLIVLLLSSFMLRLVNNAATAHVFSNRVSKILLPILGLFPIFPEFLLFVMLLRVHFPDILRRFRLTPFSVTAGILVASCILGWAYPDSYTQFSLLLTMAALLFAVLAVRFSGAPAAHGSYFLSVSFGLDLGIRAMNQFFYLFIPVHSLAHLNLTTLSATVFATGVLIFVLMRFSQKFKESEHLTRQLTSMNAELDHRAEQKAMELTREKADRHGMMLNIFHDLRSPLYVSSECLKALREKDENSEEYLTILSERLGFMNRLVEDLFLTAKMESDDFLLVTDPVDFTALFESQCSAMSLAFQEAGIPFSFTVSEGIYVWGDSFRLGQAIQNLLQNALIYTPSGQNVNASAETNGSDMFFYVRDTGKGIAPEDIPNIFTRYYRVNRANHPQSTGLGLSIANEIMKAHHGSLKVESELGVGTTFIGRLPLLEENR